MERRIVLVGLAALAATPALAQSAPTSPPPATDAPAAPAPAAPAPEPAPAMKMDQPLDISDAVKTHRKDTMAVGALSLALSRIAQPKVKGQQLKQFTEFEIAEQDTTGDILKTMMMPGVKPMGEVKAPTEAELMAALDPADKAMVEKMHAMKAGEAFDHAYLKAEIEGHQKLLAIQTAYLKAADNLDETHVAKLAKGMILEHLTLLSDIEKHYG